MAALRREMHEDVRGVVATANAVTDWHRYITGYPWVALTAAFSAGYLIVPRRHKASAAVATQADLSKVRDAVETTRQAVVDTAQNKTQGEEAKKKSLFAAALGIAAPYALRAAQGYAMKYLEHWLLQQQMRHAHAGPPPFTGKTGGHATTQPEGPRRAKGPGPL